MKESNGLISSEDKRYVSLVFIKRETQITFSIPKNMHIHHIRYKYQTTKMPIYKAYLM